MTLNHCFWSDISNKKFTFLNGGGLNPPTPPPSSYATEIENCATVGVGYRRSHSLQIVSRFTVDRQTDVTEARDNL